MMTGSVKREIEKTLNDLGVKVEDILLFGSRARGDYKEHSDWDILVILDEDLDPIKKKKIWCSIYKRLHKKFPLSSFDIILKSKATYEKEKEVVNTLANEVHREGIRL